MAKQFQTPIDLSGLEILNARAQNLPSAPASPTGGRFYFDTTKNQLGVYTGSVWLYLTPAATQYTDQNAQDAVGALIAAGTQSGITVTYSSTAHTLSFTVAADAAATTPSLRTLGTGAQQAAAGTDARLSDTRTPTDGSVTTAKIAAAGLAPSAITGTAVVTADSRLSDQRVPTDGSVTNAKVAAAAAISSDKLADGTTNGVYTLAERSKLAGIAPGATNYTDTNARANRLDQFAAPTALVSFGGQRATNGADPTGATDLVTKQYADALRQGLSVKDPVVVATTVNVTLSGEQTIDGVTTSTSRVLVKNNTTAAQNGIYVSGTGAWVRATDSDTTGEITEGTAVWVQSGTTQANTRWIQTGPAPITIGTTSQSWTMDFAATSTTAGNGLTASGNVFNVGQGTGIAVTADAIALDTTVAVRKYATAVGDGTSASITVTHNLGTQDTIVRVYRNSSPFDEVEVDVQHPNTTSVILVFATAPTTGAFRVVVHA